MAEALGEEQYLPGLHGMQLDTFWRRVSGWKVPMTHALGVTEAAWQ